MAFGATPGSRNILARRSGSRELDDSQLEIELGLDRADHLVDQRGHFRSLTSASAADRRHVAAAADRIWDLYRAAAEREMAQSARFKSLRKQVAGSDASPVETAFRLRQFLKFSSDGVIPSVVRVAESLGVLVGYMPRLSDDVSAYSCWFDEMPVMLVRSMLVGRRRVRFDTAHELAHLLLHQDVPPGRPIEREANIFAGELLLPELAMREFAGPFEWSRVFEAVDKFEVTVPALLRRLRELDILGPVVYRAALMHSYQSGRRRDPRDALPTERVNALLEIAQRYLDSGRPDGGALLECARAVRDAGQI